VGGEKKKPRRRKGRESYEGGNFRLLGKGWGVLRGIVGGGSPARQGVLSKRNERGREKETRRGERAFSKKQIRLKGSQRRWSFRREDCTGSSKRGGKKSNCGSALFEKRGKGGKGKDSRERFL